MIRIGYSDTGGDQFDEIEIAVLDRQTLDISTPAFLPTSVLDPFGLSRLLHCALATLLACHLNPDPTFWTHTLKRHEARPR